MKPPITYIDYIVKNATANVGNCKYMKIFIPAVNNAVADSVLHFKICFK